MAKELELEQDDSFQKKMWKFQRAGIIFILFILILALTGLLGSGPLSIKKNQNEFLRIEYPFLARFSHPEIIKLSVLDQKDDTIKIIVNRNYLANISIEGIIPQPLEESVYKDFIEFRFLFSEAVSNEIYFNIQFRKGGLLKGEWGLKNKNIITINHLIFP